MKVTYNKIACISYKCSSTVENIIKQSDICDCMLNHHKMWQLPTKSGASTLCWQLQYREWHYDIQRILNLNKGKHNLPVILCI